MQCLAARSAFVLAAGLAVLWSGAPALATDPCLGDAKVEFVECKGTCKENLQVAKDDCMNRDHACMEVCRAVREECQLATGLWDDLAVCRDALRAAKDDCRAAHPEGSAELDACIDAAQVAAYGCRRSARIAARPALELCQSAFRTCAKACPPPDEPSEVVDPLACKLAAKDTANACKAACREDRQVQKDLCLNRDHVCVEGCRAGRDACRLPAEDQLDAAVAACNAQRDADVAACAGDQGCLDGAYVAAFQCRDAAREVAKPALRACRDGFRACAEACPPAS